MIGLRRFDIGQGALRAAFLRFGALDIGAQSRPLLVMGLGVRGKLRIKLRDARVKLLDLLGGSLPRLLLLGERVAQVFGRPLLGREVDALPVALRLERGATLRFGA